jgi:3-hydroxyacyl-[acyl-carrier-protein] dehydratase
MHPMLDHAAVRALLPQGHPMMLVDRVIRLEPSVSIVGIKAISGCEPCYRALPAGLGPECYAYPASLLLESFGQTAAILWLTSMGGSGVDDAHVLMLAAARSCRIVGRAYPGDVMEHTARVSHVVGDNVFVEGETRVGDRLVASIESMVAVMRPRVVW